MGVFSGFSVGSDDLNVFHLQYAAKVLVGEPTDDKLFTIKLFFKVLSLHRVL